MAGGYSMTSAEMLETMAESALASHQRISVVGRQQRSGPVLHDFVWRSGNEAPAIEPMPDDLLVTAGAGVTLSFLNQALASFRQWVPYEAPDGIDDTLGAVLGMGLDCPWRAGWGPLADRVVAMKVWTPAFGLLDLGAKVVKNVAGFNLHRLFLGSRAKFGIILEATLKVSPLPPERSQWLWTESLAKVPQLLERLAQPGKQWAQILGWGTPENYQVLAEWHGYAAMVNYLRETLGTVNVISDHGLPRTSHDSPAVTGAVPRSRLVTWAQQAGPQLLLEWQTGWFWLPVASAETSRWIAAVRKLDGIAIATRGVEYSMMPGEPTARTIIARLKSHFDPLAVLGGGDD
ncbi:MAG: FAD-linked oxidase [Sulfobacillus benefaciens]|uniref:FAD-linked oxidase n=1 Tax=Sulfobacillus benefaciens TaxID=453960 RepID=A0A2T2XL97_9FIRM|nr:MAG: FAD-linked oxidase [Sulfobacillus benefaciens]